MEGPKRTIDQITVWLEEQKALCKKYGHLTLGQTMQRLDLADALAEASEEAKQQIEYLHGKFQETGTGNAVIARLESALSAYRGEK